FALLAGLALFLASGLELPGQDPEPTGALPLRVDHTKNPFFPPICHQESLNSCAQDCAHYYLIGYDLRRREKKNPGLLLSSRFPWSFLNGGFNNGSELTDGLVLAREMGVLSQDEDPLFSTGRVDAWPNGYAHYRRAMRHRTGAIQYFPLATPDGIDRAKRWLAGDEKTPGRLLGSDIRLENVEQRERKADDTRQRPLIVSWGKTGDGHTLTLAGYDDQIGYDRNGDGRVGNDLDLNSDGKITPLDWEKGAFLVVNSFGPEWGKAGTAWVLYSAAARATYQRSRWAVGVQPAPDRLPRLTLRLSFETEDRSCLRFLVGRKADARVFRPLLFSNEKWSVPGAPTKGPNQHSRFALGESTTGAFKPGGRNGSAGIEMGFNLSPTWTPTEAAEGLFFLEARTTKAIRTWLLEASIRQYNAKGQLTKTRLLTDTPILLGEQPLRLQSP
ncbi:MAG: hypothetical protein AAF514_11245, partial [Verrucomicrobiota bacterium]